MGKNHRHKKKLKSEKSKTQLKTATKFLPKGQNVTKTEFKIKPIVVPTQLQRPSDESQRKVDLKDVLSRMKHYNENMLVKACEDMEYLMVNHKSELSEVHLAEVIQNIASFMQSKTSKTRKAGLHLTNICLRSFSTSELEPHFYYFSVNLRCAMTHIDRNIQEESILFLDCLLSSVPSLMARHSGQILPDALTLISKLKSDVELRRTVTVNLQSKFTSLGWRLLVFSKLYAFVEAIVREFSHKIKDSADDLQCVTVYMDECSQKPILKPANELFNPKISVIDYPWREKENKNSISHQLSLIVPLLHETWLEGATDRATCLCEETAMLLNCIVKIYNLIWSQISLSEEENMLKKTTLDGEKLITCLLRDFPYSLINRPKQLPKADKFLNLFVANDVKCTQENLLICYLYLILFCNNPQKAKQNDLKKIIKYVTSHLTRDYSNTPMNVTYLMSILEHVLVDKAVVWSKNKMNVCDLLENAVALYTTGNLNQESKSVLLKILATVNLETLLGNKCYQSWLEALPELLLEKTVSEDTINRMFDMCRKNNTSFLKGYLNQFLLILENLPHLEITNCKDPDTAKLKIIDMLFYAPPFSQPLQFFKSILAKNSPYWSRIEYNYCLRKDFDRD